MRFFVLFVFGYCVVFDLVLCTSEVIFLSVLVFLVFVRFSYMYILSGLWSLHRSGQCSFVFFSGNLAFHRFSHIYVVLELFLVVYLFCGSLQYSWNNYRAVGCLWTFSRFLWSQYF